MAWSGATVSFRVYIQRLVMSPIPTVAVSGRRHPRVSDPTYTRGLCTVSDRAFPVASSRLWNNLPTDACQD